MTSNTDPATDPTRLWQYRELRAHAAPRDLVQVDVDPALPYDALHAAGVLLRFDDVRLHGMLLMHLWAIEGTAPRWVTVPVPVEDACDRLLSVYPVSRYVFDVPGLLTVARRAAGLGQVRAREVFMDGPGGRTTTWRAR